MSVDMMLDEAGAETADESAGESAGGGGGDCGGAARCGTTSAEGFPMVY